ncbi:hypothetical protein [Archangium sp.]|uniref:hypothetical protein n=1 Tax=Archangium sp. TaxID=1872627 RepID=UPI0038999C6D
MKAAFTLFRSLDQHLLLNHPELWLLRLPLVHAAACLLFLLSLPVALAQLSLDALPDPSSLYIRLYLISGAASLGWMYLQYRDSKSLPFRARARWYPRVIGLWYCLMIINAPAILSSWIMHERISRLVDPVTLERDTTLIRELHECLGKGWTLCPDSNIKDRYGAVLSRYGLIEDKGDAFSYYIALTIGGRLKEVEGRMDTLRRFQLEQSGLQPTNAAEASPSYLRKTSWNLAVTALFAAAFVFIGSAQWASFMWFLAPILNYLGLVFLMSKAGLGDPSVPVALFLLVLIVSCVYVARARRKSPALAAAWGILNFTYLVILIITLPGAGALLLYALSAPLLQNRQDRLRALPV